jgi:uncharacterized protein YkwD
MQPDAGPRSVRLRVASLGLALTLALGAVAVPGFTSFGSGVSAAPESATSGQVRPPRGATPTPGAPTAAPRPPRGATSTPRPATVAPRPATSTPRPATATPRRATATPARATATPRRATATPRPASTRPPRGSTPTPYVTPTTAPRPGTTGSYGCPDGTELQMLRLINDFRAQNGVGPVTLSPTLTNAAEFHSRDMAARNYFSHDLPGIGTWSANIGNHGYRPATRAETIAAGYSDAQRTFQQWVNSPGHRSNMLNPSLTAIGIGAAYGASSTYGTYWTTTFGGTVDSRLAC